MANTPRNSDLAQRLLKMITSDPETARYLDTRTKAFLERPKRMDRHDESWEACRRTMIVLLLLDIRREIDPDR